MASPAVSRSSSMGYSGCGPAALSGRARPSGRSAGVKPMLSSIFVDRPRLSIVIAIVTAIAGALAMMAIPLAQYPDIVPPQVSVTTSYPGASAEVVDSTAPGLRPNQLPRPVRRGGRFGRRPADRVAGRRRRQADLHEERERQRRQL